jgi:diaminopimelate epimerase
MPLHFTKMHGLGNDFVVINAINQTFDAASCPIMRMADRHLGIGFDQLLVIEPSTEADFFCRIYNADGSEAEQCGNGLRCIARYLHEEKLHVDASLRIQTKAGIFPIHIHDYQHIAVTMGAPTIISTDPVSFSMISVGNPHAILKVDSVDQIPDASMPEANVGFMEVISRERIRLRTIERGAGETHACGSNACAAVVSGMMNGWLGSSVTVEFRYGTLIIEWEGDDHPIRMSGPAASVFVGIWD